MHDAVHPLAIIGITGVIVNALNLMPIGSLDGGRIAMSAFGRKAGGVLGTVTLLLQASFTDVLFDLLCSGVVRFGLV